jgi:hypothetical protein
MVVWNVTPHSLVRSTFRSADREQVHMNSGCIPNSPNGITYQKTVTLIFTVFRTYCCCVLSYFLFQQFSPFLQLFTLSLLYSSLCLYLDNCRSVLTVKRTLLIYNLTFIMSSTQHVSAETCSVDYKINVRL